jgi:hypothetical protein
LRVVASIGQLITANKLAEISANQAAAAQARLGMAGGLGGVARVAGGAALAGGGGYMLNSSIGNYEDGISAGDALTTIGSSAAIGAGIGSIVPGVGTAIGAGVGAAGGAVVVGVGKLLGFDDGGRVPGPKGAPQLILAHGGETVAPTHKYDPEMLGGTVYVTQTVTVNGAQMDERTLARELDGLARKAAASQTKTRRYR